MTTSILTSRIAAAAASRKTTKGRAEAVFRAVCDYARETGHKPEVECFIRREGKRDWRVSYEAGPESWGVAASYALGALGIFAEPYYSFDLVFCGD